MDPALVTEISGPVSLTIFEYQNRRFSFFGDVHFSKSSGCGGKCDEMNQDRSDVILKGGNCMNIDAAIHTWLLYNNLKKIPTDFYFEHPRVSRNWLAERNKEARKRQAKSGWLGELGYLAGPCFERPDKCYYGTSKIHYADLRQYVERHSGGVTDIMTWLATLPGKLELVKVKEIEEYIELVKLIYNNLESIFYATVRPGSLQKFEDFATEIKKNTKLGGIGKMASETISKLMQKSLTRNKKTYVGVGGKESSVYMHKTAWELYRLFKKDSATAKLINTFATGKLNEVIADRAEILKSLEVLSELNKFMDDRELFSESLGPLIGQITDSTIALGAMTMDIYALARMFFRDSKEVILMAGDKHIKHYTEFFQSSGAKLLFQQEGFYERDVAVRCVSSAELPVWIDFNQMRRELKRTGEYETARLKISDFDIS